MVTDRDSQESTEEMTNQEAIREGIEKVICSCCDDVGVWHGEQTLAEAQEYCRKEAVCAYCTELREAILEYEVSKGVVIKVERELPDGLYLSRYFGYPIWLTKHEVKAIMDLAVEPLIGDKDG